MKSLLSYIAESVFDTLDKSEKYDNDFIISSLVQDFFSQLDKSKPVEYSLKSGKLTTRKLILTSDGEEKISSAMQHLQDMGAVTEIDCDYTHVYGYKEVNPSIFTSNLTTSAIEFCGCGNCRDVNINIRGGRLRPDYPVYIRSGMNQEIHFNNVTINYDHDVPNKVIYVHNPNKKITKLTGIQSNAEYIIQATNGPLFADLSQILEPSSFNVSSKWSKEIGEIKPSNITKTISEINKANKAYTQIFGSYPLNFKKGARFSNFIQDVGLPDLKAYFICNNSVGLLFLAPDGKSNHVEPLFVEKLIPSYRIGEVRVQKKPTSNRLDIMPRPISADGWELVICKIQRK